jgi:5,10-methylene-tetrahydrofolate dehydrogenase/methenyl tetrahydrofolate cyclohydrolase
LGEKAVRNVYHNKRFIDDENTMKSVIPCTPLAIMKVAFGEVLIKAKGKRKVKGRGHKCTSR